MSDASGLANRIQVIEDRIAISELRSKYCWYTTRGMRDEVVRLFAEDCIFQNVRGGKQVVVKGCAALGEHLSAMKPARRVPLVMNEVTSVNGDRADGTCVMQSIGNDGFCGHYVDDFTRIDGVWHFSARRFFPYWPEYLPDADRRDP